MGERSRIYVITFSPFYSSRLHQYAVPFLCYTSRYVTNKPTIKKLYILISGKVRVFIVHAGALTRPTTDRMLFV